MDNMYEHYQENHRLLREAENKYKREERAYRIRLGLCTVCGKNNHKEGMRRCEECIEKERKRRHAIELKRQANGLCTYCGKQNENPNNRLCPKCIEKKQEYKKKWALTRKQMKHTV